jgi:hypothetical protein
MDEEQLREELHFQAVAFARVNLLVDLRQREIEQLKKDVNTLQCE